MTSIDTVVIGAGQAGLAASHCLRERGVDHVVLERGRIAERWLSARWDSLRLLTPNWMSRLPGWSYRGPDPNGFMTAGETWEYFRSYADASAAPVVEHTPVERVRRLGDRFEVATGAMAWNAANVVLATGWCEQAAVPQFASALDPSVVQVDPAAYRNPRSLPDGGVLVVGASATGAQLAEELAGAGRRVVLAVGRHTRLPRRYRGMDIFWWLQRIGSLDRTIDELSDPVAARHEPSLQLVGRPDHRNLDLTTLADAGVELTGHLCSTDGHVAHFAADLADTVMSADARLARVLAEVDRHITEAGLASEVFEPEPQRTLTVGRPIERLDLHASDITSVIWATGHRRTYPWLHVPVLDERGEIRQRCGVTPVPGLYVLGQRFQHRRSSNFIEGVGRDAAYVVEHLAQRRTAVRA